MERLVQGLGKNSPQEYDEIFKDRMNKGIDGFDLRRWRVLIKYFRKGRVLDLGCLDSLVLEMAKMKNLKAECWGIDYAEDAINIMQKMYPDIIYQTGDVYNTKFPSGYFNYVVAGQLLEHIEEPKKCIDEAFRILKKNGILAISVPLEEKNGEVDKERHLWSFKLDDFKELFKPYEVFDYKILRSKYFPKYKYSFPVLVIFGKKIYEN